MGKSGGFYAVAIGRSTGVYTSWGDAEAQVKGFAGARYKKFPTQVQAEAFVVSQGRGSAPVKPVHHEAASSNGRKREWAECGASSESGDGTDGTISPPDTKRRVTVADAEVKAVSKQLVQVDTIDLPSASDGCEASSVSSGKISYWYAVAKGRKTGVYDNWADARVQIEGLFSAKFKKFPTKAEAEAFIRDHQEATQSQNGDPDPKHPDSLVAFCDGSALQNGRFGCQAGFACIFPHNPSWNVAKKLVEDRATNNRAEYLAALEAMKRANQEDSSQTRPLYIFSDSMLLIRSMTEWITGWQKKNWTKADGNPVLNRDLLELLLKEKGSRRVIWRHVKAHTGRKDWHSKWNDVADHAARNAAAGWEPTSSA